MQNHESIKSMYSGSKNMSFDYVSKQPTLYLNNPQNKLPVDNTIQNRNKNHYNDFLLNIFGLVTVSIRLGYVSMYRYCNLPNA